MAEAKPIQLNATQLTGDNLIEAAAGTGKTYTIAWFYLRLVLEQRLPVNRILVVTFTEAATAELRERVRARLVETATLLAASDEAARDQRLRELLERLCGEGGATRAELLALLRRAILEFDRAAIYTIHAFCQRLLGDRAFETGSLFELEILTDETELLHQTLLDFWRTRVQSLQPDALTQLGAITPESLANSIRGYIGRPYLDLSMTTDETNQLAQASQALKRAMQVCREHWRDTGEEIRAALTGYAGFNRNTLRLSTVEVLLKVLPIALWVGDPYECVDKNNKKGKREEKLGSHFLYSSKALKKGFAPVEFAFFEAWQEALFHRAEVERLQTSSLQNLTRQALEFCNQQLPKRKRDLAVLGYNDMLLNLHRSLRDAEITQTLGEHWSAALVDEFQDTDPLQFDIFTRLFRGRLPFFMVGDPKQAIYSFRGADLFAYLNASDEHTQCHSLNHNFRSTLGVIEGCNALFSAHPRPFLFGQIGFQPAAQGKPAADSKPRPELLEGGRQLPAFRLRWLASGESGKPWNKQDAKAQIADDASAEILRLLQLAAADQLAIDGQPLHAGQIAVLVRSHAEGELMAEALRQHGVRSVQRSKARIFATDESEQLYRLLNALVNPADTRLLRTALITPLLGQDAARLDQLEQDDGELDRLQQAFRELLTSWREAGIYPMARRLFDSHGVEQRLLGRAGGERSLTNLRQLLQLLHQQESSARPSPAALVEWFSLQRQGEASEEQELHLESDEDLVQILTIHVSKGLEYPVVFCPFLWDGALHAERSSILQWHDPDQQFKACVEFDPASNPAAQAAALKEELAERLRLLYVALTRARERVYLHWGRISEAGASAIGVLLFPPSDDPLNSAHALKTRFKEFSDDEYLAPFRKIAEEIPEHFRIEAIGPGPETRLVSRSAEPEHFSARQLHRTLVPGPELTSFTALTREQDEEQRPDHDEFTEQGSPADGVEPLDAATDPSSQRDSTESEVPLAQLPRGAAIGNFLHGLLEHLPPWADDARIEQLVASALPQQGLDPGWQRPLGEMLRRVLDTPLGADSLRLSRLQPGQFQPELEFHFPLGRITPAALHRVLQRHADEIPAVYIEASKRLGFGELAGYLHGYIDLVYQLDGRYWLLDYKSNHLGDHPSDYRLETMQREMANHHYYLQYLLYAVALHRHLRLRLADYDPARHWGGVQYLFLRGMGCGPDLGMVATRPGEGLLEDLDALLGG